MFPSNSGALTPAQSQEVQPPLLPPQATSLSVFNRLRLSDYSEPAKLFTNRSNLFHSVIYSIAETSLDLQAICMVMGQVEETSNTALAGSKELELLPIYYKREWYRESVVEVGNSAGLFGKR